jgi:transcriptional regulator with XRE-family HTH domain
MLGIWTRIKKLADLKGLSISEMERIFDVKATFISASIANDRMPKADLALRISDYFGVSYRWLIEGEDKDSLDPESFYLFQDKKILEIALCLKQCNEIQMAALQAMLKAFEV